MPPRFSVGWSDLTIGWTKHNVLEAVSNELNLEQWNWRVPIVGRTGWGKSTLLYSIAGLKQLTGGSVIWAVPGHESIVWGKGSTTVCGATRAQMRSHPFSFAFQDSALLPHLSVAENLRYPLDLAMEKSDFKVDDLTATARKALDRVLIGSERASDFLDRSPSQFSGGQKRRIAIAQAMATNPQVLFLDEPAGGLDPISKNEVMSSIHEWIDDAPSDMPRAVFWVTHHRDAKEFSQCKKVLMFDQSDGLSRLLEVDPDDILVEQ